MEHCIVVGAGCLDMPHIPVQAGDYVIAVDGGMQHCRRLGLHVDKYIGDFDSLPEQFLNELNRIEAEEPERVVRLIPEKDDTDMLAALKAALKIGFSRFTIYGATGGRLDHTIANIQSLLYLKRHGAWGTMVDAENHITVIENETLRFPPRAGGTISLFALGNRAAGVTLEGLKYPLKDAVLTNDFPIGISNEFLGQEAAVTVQNGALAVLIQKEGN